MLCGGLQNLNFLLLYYTDKKWKEMVFKFCPSLGVGGRGPHIFWVPTVGVLLNCFNFQKLKQITNVKENSVIVNNSPVSGSKANLTT